MRYFSAVLITLLVMTLAGVQPHLARADYGVFTKTDVKVSLAVVEGGRQSTASAIHVIIENISDKSQSHFDEWNSWGYGNLTLQWTDDQGHTGTVAKVPGAWAQDGPTTTVINPGEALVRDVSFDPKLWQGWPTITGSTKLTLKATYRATGEPRVLHAEGWIGTVTSKEQTVTFFKPAASG